jgi:hypothetical protein
MKSHRLVILPALLAAAAFVAFGCGSDSRVPTSTSGGVTDEEVLSPGTFQGGDSTGSHVFAAILTGEEETPPVTTTARGVVRFQLDGDSLLYRLGVLDIENMTSAKIHLAPAGEDGPAIATLYPGDTIRAHLSARFEGVATADSVMTWEEFLSEVEAGNAYVDVTTTQNPEGEIRGRIALIQGGGAGSGGDHGNGDDDNDNDGHSGNSGDNGNGHKRHKHR